MAKTLEVRTQDCLGVLQWQCLILQQRLDESDEKLSQALTRAEQAEQELATLKAGQ